MVILTNKEVAARIRFNAKHARAQATEIRRTKQKSAFARCVAHEMANGFDQMAEEDEWYANQIETWSELGVEVDE